MQFEHATHSLAPKDGKPPIPAYMEFTPDNGQCFQILTSGSRRHAVLQPIRGDLARIPINGEDVEPLREATALRDDKKLLEIIRKYIQTRGLGLKPSKPDSLHGTVHTVPEGSIMYRGRVPHPLQDELEELPIPRVAGQ
jgi:hypothetical protein